MDTHGMFICSVTDAANISGNDSITYAYYHKNLKPAVSAGARGFVCRICGYIYQGETLPADFVCPICRHGADDFEKLN